MAEKDLYSVGVGENESHTHEARDIKDVVDAKGVAVGEAADVYGDVQTAEEYGYVHRGSVVKCSQCTSLLHSSLHHHPSIIKMLPSLADSSPG